MKTKPSSRFIALAFVATAMIAASPANAALISYQSLDTSTGLTLNNGAAITSGSLGKFGEALSLDGINDFAQVTAGTGITPLGGQQRTVSAWVFQDTGASGLRTPVSLGNNTGGNKWDFDIDNLNGGIEVGVNGGRNAGTGLSGLTGSWMLVTSTLPVTSGTVGQVKTYLNGAVTNASGGSPTVDTTTTTFLLGQAAEPTSTDQYFDGRVDDVAIWDEALTDNEIKGLFDVGNSSALSYTAGTFDFLKQRHALATGSTIIGAREWIYATGLTGPAGLTSGVNGSFTLVLNSASGTGLTVVPEPSTALLGALGFLVLLRRRR